MQWLDHRITKEIFRTEDETSKSPVNFWTFKAYLLPYCYASFSILVKDGDCCIKLHKCPKYFFHDCSSGMRDSVLLLVSSYSCCQVLEVNVCTKSFTLLLNGLCRFIYHNVCFKNINKNKYHVYIVWCLLLLLVR